jgi:putative phosphoesterase
MRIGVISDTHGRLEARALESFGGVERIFHAGDVGSEEILAKLASLAPVTAVLGNVDGPSFAGLKEAEWAEAEGVRFLIFHQLGTPERPTPKARRLIREGRPGMVIFGHTHSPCDRVVEGVRFFNPGGSGPRRFSLPRTVAILEVSGARVEARFVDLDARPEEARPGRER